MILGAASSPQDLALARELFLEYAESLGFSLCFQGFDHELATLPGRYAPPHGGLLLARAEDGRFAGCVALRPLEDEGRCEMKRLYVRPWARGTGLGRRLAVAIVDEARRRGHREMVLDTLDTMTPALGLYRSLGFEPVAPYTPNPLPGAVFLALDLRR